MLIGGLTKSERLMTEKNFHVACHAEPIPFVLSVRDAAPRQTLYFTNVLKLGNDLGRFSKVTAAKWGEYASLTSSLVDNSVVVALEFSKYDGTVVNAGTTIMFFSSGLAFKKSYMIELIAPTNKEIGFYNAAGTDTGVFVMAFISGTTATKKF